MTVNAKSLEQDSERFNLSVLLALQKLKANSVFQLVY